MSNTQTSSAGLGRIWPWLLWALVVIGVDQIT